MAFMTEIEKYDRSVFQYLSTISGNIIYSPTHMAMRNITKREIFKDDNPWEFISYYRSSTFDIDWSRMNNYGTIQGDFTGLQVNTAPVTEVKANFVKNIPVNLAYNVEIWGSKAAEVQERAIALITKLYMTDQVIKVPINPNGEDGRFHLLDITWTDNSDLEREVDVGKIYRHTIGFTIDARITLPTTISTVRFCEIPIEIYE